MAAALRLPHEIPRRIGSNGSRSSCVCVKDNAELDDVIIVSVEGPKPAAARRRTQPQEVIIITDSDSDSDVIIMSDRDGDEGCDRERRRRKWRPHKGDSPPRKKIKLCSENSSPEYGSSSLTSSSAARSIKLPRVSLPTSLTRQPLRSSSPSPTKTEPTSNLLPLRHHTHLTTSPRHTLPPSHRPQPAPSLLPIRRPTIVSTSSSQHVPRATVIRGPPSHPKARPSPTLPVKTRGCPSSLGTDTTHNHHHRHGYVQESQGTPNGDDRQGITMSPSNRPFHQSRDHFNTSVSSSGRSSSPERHHHHKNHATVDRKVSSPVRPHGPARSKLSLPCLGPAAPKPCSLIPSDEHVGYSSGPRDRHYDSEQLLPPTTPPLDPKQRRGEKHISPSSTPKRTHRRRVNSVGDTDCHRYNSQHARPPYKSKNRHRHRSEEVPSVSSRKRRRHSTNSQDSKPRRRLRISDFFLHDDDALKVASPVRQLAKHSPSHRPPSLPSHRPPSLPSHTDPPLTHHHHPASVPRRSPNTPPLSPPPSFKVGRPLDPVHPSRVHESPKPSLRPCSNPEPTSAVVSPVQPISLTDLPSSPRPVLPRPSPNHPLVLPPLPVVLPCLHTDHSHPNLPLCSPSSNLPPLPLPMTLPHSPPFSLHPRPLSPPRMCTSPIPEFAPNSPKGKTPLGTSGSAKKKGKSLKLLKSPSSPRYSDSRLKYTWSQSIVKPESRDLELPPFPLTRKEQQSNGRPLAAIKEEKCSLSSQECGTTDATNTISTPPASMDLYSDISSSSFSSSSSEPTKANKPSQTSEHSCSMPAADAVSFPASPFLPALNGESEAAVSPSHPTSSKNYCQRSPVDVLSLPIPTSSPTTPPLSPSPCSPHSITPSSFPPSISPSSSSPSIPPSSSPPSIPSSSSSPPSIPPSSSSPPSIPPSSSPPSIPPSSSSSPPSIPPSSSPPSIPPSSSSSPSIPPLPPPIAREITHSEAVLFDQAPSTIITTSSAGANPPQVYSPVQIGLPFYNIPSSTPTVVRPFPCNYGSYLSTYADNLGKSLESVQNYLQLMDQLVSHGCCIPSDEVKKYVMRTFKLPRETDIRRMHRILQLDLSVRNDVSIAGKTVWSIMERCLEWLQPNPANSHALTPLTPACTNPLQSPDITRLASKVVLFYLLGLMAKNFNMRVEELEGSLIEKVLSLSRKWSNVRKLLGLLFATLEEEERETVGPLDLLELLSSAICLPLLTCTLLDRSDLTTRLAREISLKLTDVSTTEKKLRVIRALPSDYLRERVIALHLESTYSRVPSFGEDDSDGDTPPSGQALTLARIGSAHLSRKPYSLSGEKKELYLFLSLICNLLGSHLRCIRGAPLVSYLDTVLSPLPSQWRSYPATVHEEDLQVKLFSLRAQVMLLMERLMQDESFFYELPQCWVYLQMLESLA